MSLTALPVTVSDLENLQLGIVRVSNPSEAGAFAALINAQSTTVFAYAQALLSQPGHSSEVVDGVISAFDLLTPTKAQFDNLVLTFLPPQIAFAQAQHLNLTVFAAETTGLGVLSNDATFISHYNTAAFANSAAGQQLAAQSIVNAVFGAAATANLNAVALQELTFWTAFFTANPSATHITNPTADQILIAARATTAGDMVGVAIDGNIGTLKSVADNVLIGDGLHLNGQGPNVLGVTEPGSVPATFLQGQPSQIFLFTEGQDTFVGHGVGDIFSAPLSVNDNPTLTDFDSAVELTPDTAASPNHAVLNASFDGGHTSAGLNLINIPTWNILQHHDATDLVQLFGGPGLFIQGLKTLNYNANGGSASLEIGTPAFPIIPMPGNTFDGFTILVANAAGAVSGAPHLDIAMASSGFGSNDKIDVTALQVGTGTDFESRFDIAAGSPNHGFKEWDVHSTVGAGNIHTNNIGLGADGSSSATIFRLSDDGSNTVLWAATATGSSASNWQNLTTVDLSHTSGDVTVTGGESGSAGFLSALSGGPLHVIGGTGFDLFDLSAFGGPHSNLFVNGGGNAEVELNNTEATAGGAFGQWTGVPTLDIVDDGTLGGTVNMLLFPGTDTVQLFNAQSQFDFPDPTQMADFNFNNAPDGFTLNAGGLDQNGFNMFFTGVGGAQNLFVNFNEIDNSSGQFGSANFDTVNIDVNVAGFDNNGSDDFYSGGILVQANPGQHAVLNITTDTLLELGGEDTTLFGPVSGGTFPENGPNPVGTPSIVITGGTLFTPIAGTLNILGTGDVEMGVTNAHVIHDTSSGFLEMTAPTSNFTDGVVVDAAGGFSLLQGSLGPLFDLLNSGNSEDVGGVLSGFVGTDSLTDTAGDTDFFGAGVFGGHDTVNLGGGGNTVHFGEFAIDEGDNNSGDFLPFTQTISDVSDSVYQGSWNVANGTLTDPADVDQNLFGSTSSSNTVISGFHSGSDILEFNTNAWADQNASGTQGITGNLVEGDLEITGAETLSPDLIDEGQTMLEEGNFLFLEPGTFGSIANASTLASLLENPVGHIFINPANGGLDPGASVHMLMAYQNTSGGVNIADVDLFNTTGATQTDTANLVVRASDMVSLVGVNFSDLFNNAVHDITLVAK